MSNFTVRVELHKAKWPDDYELLHKEMAKEGFGRTVKKEGEPAYKLPWVEYTKGTDDTTIQVLESAKKASANSWNSYSILVTKAEGSREWYNLEEAK